MKKFLLFILISSIGYVCLAEDSAVARPFFAAVHQYVLEHGGKITSADISMSSEGTDTYKIENIYYKYQIIKKGLFSKKPKNYMRVHNVTITKSNDKSFQVNLDNSFQYAQFNEDYSNQVKEWKNEAGSDEYTQELIDNITNDISKYRNANKKEYDKFTDSALTDSLFLYEIFKKKNNVWSNNFLEKFKMSEDDELQGHWGPLLPRGKKVSFKMCISSVDKNEDCYPPYNEYPYRHGGYTRWFSYIISGSMVDGNNNKLNVLMTIYTNDKSFLEKNIGDVVTVKEKIKSIEKNDENLKFLLYNW